MFQRRHYEAIAATLRKSRERGPLDLFSASLLDSVARDVADMFAADNDSFRRSAFMEAARARQLPDAPPARPARVRARPARPAGPAVCWPYWHDVNPWRENLIYVPLLLAAELCAQGGETVDSRIDRWRQDGGLMLDAYILPGPDHGSHSIGVRYGAEGSQYYSPCADQARVTAWLAGRARRLEADAPGAP